MQLHKVNVAGQRHRDVQSFMAPSLAHDTTRVIRCPIFTRQRPPRTESAENAQCYSRSPIGVPTPLHKVNVAGQRDRDMQLSCMAPSQSHDTTRVTRCPIFTRQRPPRT